MFEGITDTVTNRSETAILTNMKLVSDRTSRTFQMMKISTEFPIKDTSIVNAYNTVTMISLVFPSAATMNVELFLRN